VARVSIVDYINRAAREAKLARAIARLGARQRRELYKIMGNPPRLENIPAEYWGEKSDEWRAMLTPELEDIFIDSAHEMLKDPELGGLAIGEDEINERARDWAVPYTLALATLIMQHRRRAIENALNDFEESQQTPDDKKQLERRITRWYGPVAAEAISITEVTTAHGAGESGVIAGLALLGVLTEEVWQTQEDERVCKICGPRHDKPRGVNWTSPPPAHPRCRCYRKYRFRNAND